MTSDGSFIQTRKTSGPRTVYAVVFERRVTSQTTNSSMRDILNPNRSKSYQCCLNSSTIMRFEKNFTEFTNLNCIRP